MNFPNPFAGFGRARTLQGVERVRLEKQGPGCYELSIAAGPHYNQYLWDHFQRDVMLSLLSGLFVMAHLDGFEPIELDDDLSALFPCTGDGAGKSFVLAGAGLLRLVTELLQVYGEYWEYGHYMNLSAFTAPPALDFPAETDVRALPGFAVKIQPLGDDLGLAIDFDPAAIPEASLLEQIAQVAAGYRLTLEQVS